MRANGRVREVTEVGRRILARLEQKGWNQARLAKECGRSYQWVTELIRHRYLSGPSIRRLCRILDVTPLYLMPEDDL
jgi:transcriptional regulator with XRE-family HTH domain